MPSDAAETKRTFALPDDADRAPTFFLTSAAPVSAAAARVGVAAGSAPGHTTARGVYRERRE